MLSDSTAASRLASTTRPLMIQKQPKPDVRGDVSSPGTHDKNV